MPLEPFAIGHIQLDFKSYVYAYVNVNKNVPLEPFAIEHIQLDFKSYVYAYANVT